MTKNRKAVCLMTAVVAIATVQLHAAQNTTINLLANGKQNISCSQNNTPAELSESIRFKTDGKYKIKWQADFEVKDPAKFCSLSLVNPAGITLTLNGKPIPFPLKGMKYSTIPGIPISMLKPGKNRLQGTWKKSVKTVKNKKTGRSSLSPSHVSATDLNIKLLGMQADDLKFQTEPVLGYAGKDFFTVSCRVNIPAEVTLTVNNRKLVSKPALLHRFTVKRLKSDTEYSYSMTAQITCGKVKSVTTGPFSVKTFPEKAPFKFAVLGDSRTYPKDWKKVADATLKEKPIFSMFVGDMITNGRIDKMWDKEYFTPAKEFLATIPYFSVIGNHEGNCPLLPLMLQTPRENGAKNWSQQIGPILLIGIDGDMNWSRDGKLAKWLENTLAKSKAKFIFLGSHYPAWTSGGHGSLNKDKRPKEKSIKQAQDTIMPLLKKYNAAAMFSGHDHFYERSEPDNGVTMIVTGGAGAPLRDKTHHAEIQNPYSVVFKKELHFCLISVEDDKCTMTVLTPQGKELDKRSWNARK